MKLKHVLIFSFFTIALTLSYFIIFTQNIHIEKDDAVYNITQTENLTTTLIELWSGFPVFSYGISKQTRLPVYIPSGEWSRGDNGLPYFNQDLQVTLDKSGKMGIISNVNISLYREDEILYTDLITLGQSPYHQSIPISSQYDERYQLKLVVKKGNFTAVDYTSVSPPWRTFSKPDYDSTVVLNTVWPLKSSLPLFLTVGSDGVSQIIEDESFMSPKDVIEWVNTTIRLSGMDDGEWLLSHEVVERKEGDPTDVALLLCTLINDSSFDSICYVVWGQNEDYETITYALLYDASGWSLVKLTNDGLRSFPYTSKQEAINSLSPDVISVRVFNHEYWEVISFR